VSKELQGRGDQEVKKKGGGVKKVNKGRKGGICNGVRVRVAAAKRGSGKVPTKGKLRNQREKLEGGESSYQADQFETGTWRKENSGPGVENEGKEKSKRGR